MSTIAVNPASSASAINSSVRPRSRKRVDLVPTDETGRGGRDRGGRRGRERRQAEAATGRRSGSGHPLLPVGVGSAQVRDGCDQERHRELVTDDRRSGRRALDAGEHARPQAVAPVRLDVGAQRPLVAGPTDEVLAPGRIEALVREGLDVRQRDWRRHTPSLTGRLERVRSEAPHGGGVPDAEGEAHEAEHRQRADEHTRDRASIRAPHRSRSSRSSSRPR